MSTNQNDLKKNGRVQLLKEIWESKSAPQANAPKSPGQHPGLPKSPPGEGVANDVKESEPELKPQSEIENKGPSENSGAPELPKPIPKAPPMLNMGNKPRYQRQPKPNVPAPVPQDQNPAIGGNNQQLPWHGHRRGGLDLNAPMPDPDPKPKKSGGIKGFFSKIGKAVGSVFKGKKSSRGTAPVPNVGNAPSTGNGPEAPKEVKLDQIQALEGDKPGVNAHGKQLYRINGALYSLGGKLGAGGLGVVYALVPENPSDKPLVVKFSGDELKRPDDQKAKKDAKKDLGSEADKLGMVSGSKNVVQGFGTQDFKVDDIKGEHTGLIMESLPNGDLKEMYVSLRAAYFSNKITYSEYTGAQQFLQRGSYQAIAELEQMGLVHMDIKGQNLMLDGDFNVKLIDVGSLLKEGERSKEPPTTPGYESPEYGSRSDAKGKTERSNVVNRALNTKYDVYSAGVMQRTRMLGPVENAPMVQKNSKQTDGTTTTTQQPFEGSASKFAKNTTNADPSKRKLASQLLHEKFLSDPLLQDHEAKALLRKVKAMKPTLENEEAKKKELKAHNDRVEEIGKYDKFGAWKLNRTEDE